MNKTKRRQYSIAAIIKFYIWQRKRSNYMLSTRVLSSNFFGKKMATSRNNRIYANFQAKFRRKQKSNQKSKSIEL